MPQPRRIDPARIVSAALELLDQHGLDGVSLHRIAARLGVRQPALYHHFGNKAELLSAVAGDVLDRRHTDRVPGDEPWDGFVARSARSLRRALMSVRDGARLITSTGTRTLNAGNAARQVNFLEKAGFSGSDAVLASIAVSRYVIGAVLEEQASRDRGATIEAPADDVAGSSHFAQVAREVAALGPDREFEVGLDALLRGLDSLRGRQP